MAGLATESYRKTWVGGYRSNRKASSYEVFILHKGSAVLIEAELKDTDVCFNCVCMKQGVIYNIPAGVWHDIAMDTDAHIIIVEKSNTHISDCEYFPLSEKQRLALYSDIKHQILL